MWKEVSREKLLRGFAHHSSRLKVTQVTHVTPPLSLPEQAEFWLRPYGLFCYFRDFFGTANPDQWGNLGTGKVLVIVSLPLPLASAITYAVGNLGTGKVLAREGRERAGEC